MWKVNLKLYNGLNLTCASAAESEEHAISQVIEKEAFDIPVMRATAKKIG